MNRLPVLFLAFTVLLLIGCGIAVPAPDVAQPTETSELCHLPPAPTEEGLLSVEGQRAFLMDHFDQWAFADPYYEPWFYTFTDLDHNGRLEVIAASTQGSGIFTYAECWEMNDAFNGLHHCSPEQDEWDAWPELIMESAPCYFDRSTGLYHYLFTDLTRDDAAHYYESPMDVCLADGQLTKTPLAFRETEYTNPDTVPVILCKDANGNPISEQDYNIAVKRAFSGLEKARLDMEWMQVSMPGTEPD